MQIAPQCWWTQGIATVHPSTKKTLKANGKKLGFKAECLMKRNLSAFENYQ